mmetsp:Transcript_9744/g.15974  ORF Transcript_9744/g.15974 Transcript_9744/m.15974 type:complete len:213 (-) Transcript_9744:609-1247(-)
MTEKQQQKSEKIQYPELYPATENSVRHLSFAACSIGVFAFGVGAVWFLVYGVSSNLFSAFIGMFCVFTGYVGAKTNSYRMLCMALGFSLVGALVTLLSIIITLAIGPKGDTEEELSKERRLQWVWFGLTLVSLFSFLIYAYLANDLRVAFHPSRVYMVENLGHKKLSVLMEGRESVESLSSKSSHIEAFRGSQGSMKGSMATDSLASIKISE